MYIFFFWPFRVFGFILTTYASFAIIEKNFPSFENDNLAVFLLFTIGILNALFWLNFIDLYFKLMDPDEAKSKKHKKKGRKKKTQSINLFSWLIELGAETLRAIVHIFNFIIGLLNPLIWIFIIITLLAAIAA